MTTRLEQHEAGGVADDEGGEEGEVVEHGHALEARDVRAPEQDGGDEGDDHPGQTHEGQVLPPAARGQEIEEHEDEAGDGEDRGGRDDAETDHGQGDGVRHLISRRGRRWPPPWSAPGL